MDVCFTVTMCQFQTTAYPWAYFFLFQEETCPTASHSYLLDTELG